MEHDELARVAFAATLASAATLALAATFDEDQLLDELLDCPSESVRYKAAFAELKRRSEPTGDERQ
jgi:hypothetical protein